MESHKSGPEHYALAQDLVKQASVVSVSNPPASQALATQALAHATLASVALQFSNMPLVSDTPDGSGLTRAARQGWWDVLNPDGDTAV